MNKTRRTAIEKIRDKLMDLLEEIEQVKDQEQEAFDNMPEGLQSSERGEAMESAISSLEEAYDSVDSAVCSLEEAMEV